MQRHTERGARALAWVCAAAAFACIKPLQLGGRQCPCAVGYACCEATGLCVPPDQLASCSLDPPDTGVTADSASPAPPGYPPPLPPRAIMPPLPDADPPPPAPDAAVPADAAAMACPGEPRGVRYFHWEGLDHSGQMVSGQAPAFSFSWPEGHPDPALPTVSAWSSVFATQLLPAISGDYTFFVKADDGFGLMIDRQPILDWGQPYDTGGHVIAATVPLQAGRRYPVLMNYYNKVGGGALELTWQPPGGSRQPIPPCELHLGPPRPANCADPFAGCHPDGARTCTPEDLGNGLDISFFANRDFTNLVHTEDVALLSFDYHWDWLYRSSTDPALRTRKFAVRWEGALRAPLSETYTFFLLSDADTTVTIGDRVLRVRADPEGIIRETSFEVPLVERAPYRIRVDYLQRGTPDTSKLQLHWKSASQFKNEILYCYLYGSAPPAVGQP